MSDDTLPPRWLDELDPELREYAEMFEVEPEPEPEPLFTPAPAVMPGQTTMGA